METILVGVFAATAFAWFLFYEWPAILDIMENNPANEFEAPAHWEEIYHAAVGNEIYMMRRWWKRTYAVQLAMSDKREGYPKNG